jgi:hypothetical protein
MGGRGVGNKKRGRNISGFFLYAVELRAPYMKIPIFLCADILNGPFGKMIFVYGYFKELYGKMQVDFYRSGYLWFVYNLLKCSSRKTIYFK